MLFSSWQSLLRIILIGVPAYLTLLLLLRIGGKRTLSKFNAFDLVVTVAFGSTLSAALLNRDVALSDVAAAFALLVALQYVITSAVLRWHGAERLIKAEPRLVFRNGQYLRGAMRKERVTEAEVEAAIRAHGIDSLQEVQAVVLETDGSFSVVGTSPRGGASALSNVRLTE